MAKLYHSVDVVERTEITRDGAVEKVYRVSAYTASDVHFTLEIKEADFNEEKVKEILGKKATLIESIKAL